MLPLSHRPGLAIPIARPFPRPFAGPASILGIAAALGVTLAVTASPALAQVDIDVDTGTTFQTMRGWEATTYTAYESPAFPALGPDAYDTVVAAGLNRIRLEVRSGSENEDYWQQYQDGLVDYDFWRSHRYATVNDNADPFVIDPAGFHFTEVDSTVSWTVMPIRDRLAANGESLYVNLCYVAFTAQIGEGLDYVHDDPEEYAELIEALWIHLDQTWGFVPDGLEILLEPDLVAEWGGTDVGNAVVAVTDRLALHGWHPDVIAPSTTSMANAITFFDQLAAVPGATDVMTEISYHRYTGVSDANLQALADRAQTHGIGTSMLEWWTGANGYETLHHDLELGANVAWQQGVVCGVGPGGAAWAYVDDTDPGDPEVFLNDMTAFTSLYYRWVRAGAVRVGASASSGTVDPLAFVNPDGTVTVIANAAATTDLRVAGLPAGTYGITYVIDAEAGAVDLPDVVVSEGDPLVTSIPWEGVLTVHGRDGVLAVDPVDPSRHPGTVRAASPVRGTGMVTIALDRPAAVTLDIVDVAGRRVRRLISGARLPAGDHAIPWEIRDDHGRRLSPGVYAIVLEAQGARSTTRVVVLN